MLTPLNIMLSHYSTMPKKGFDMEARWTSSFLQEFIAAFCVDAWMFLKSIIYCPSQSNYKNSKPSFSIYPSCAGRFSETVHVRCLRWLFPVSSLCQVDNTLKPIFQKRVTLIPGCWSAHPMFPCQSFGNVECQMSKPFYEMWFFLKYCRVET